MTENKIQVGDIRPVYNITGFEVCKITSDNPKEIQWIPVEKISDAEILSFIYQQNKNIESVPDEVPEIEPAKTKKKNGKTKNKKTKKEIEAKLKEINKEIKEIKESEEAKINDEEL